MVPVDVRSGFFFFFYTPLITSETSSISMKLAGSLITGFMSKCF